MEVEFNELFDAYRELYFEGGTSSVYLWDLDHGFAGCFLVKKSKYSILLLSNILALATFQMWKETALLNRVAGTQFISWK